MKVLCFYIYNNDFNFCNRVYLTNKKTEERIEFESPWSMESRNNLFFSASSSILDHEPSKISADNCQINSHIGDHTCSSQFQNYNASAKVKDIRMYKCKRCIPMDGYQLSYFIYLLKQSALFRMMVFNFNTYDSLPGEIKSVVLFKIRLLFTEPSFHVMDYKWCKHLETTCYEQLELSKAMAWLSTLGGAFSALGDKTERCAVIAGRISIQQLKNALKLGDPLTIVRCKLYYSLSLIQQRKYKIAKRIIREQYHIALINAEKDFKLVRMCLGIWSKLQYEKKYKRTERIS